MRLAIVAVVGMASTVMMSNGSRAQTDVDLPIVTRCLEETDATALRGCVQNLGNIIRAHRQLRQAEREVLVECSRLEEVSALRQCIAETAKPLEKKETEQTEALKKALRTWEVRRDTSRMDSSTRVFLALESDDEVEIGYGRRERPILWLRCIENTTAAIINADWYLDASISVQFRVGDEKPVAQTWTPSTDRKAAGLWDGARAIPFIKSLLGKKALLVRLSTYNQGAKEMAFNIEGLDRVIDPLRTACKW